MSTSAKVYLRGSQIRYFILPDMLRRSELPKEGRCGKFESMNLRREIGRTPEPPKTRA